MSTPGSLPALPAQGCSGSPASSVTARRGQEPHLPARPRRMHIPALQGEGKSPKHPEPPQLREKRAPGMLRGSHIQLCFPSTRKPALPKPFPSQNHLLASTPSRFLCSSHAQAQKCTHSPLGCSRNIAAITSRQPPEPEEQEQRRWAGKTTRLMSGEQKHSIFTQPAVSPQARRWQLYNLRIKKCSQHNNFCITRSAGK